MLKSFLKARQEDIDHAAGLALGLDLPATPETVQLDITGRPVKEQHSEGEVCPECGEPDLHYDSCRDLADFEPYYECYSCGYHYTVKE